MKETKFSNLIEFPVNTQFLPREHNNVSHTIQLIGHNEEANYRSFCLSIIYERADLAGKHLESMFGVDEHQGHASAQYFLNRYQKDPTVIADASKIRDCIASKDTGNGIQKLKEYFDIHGDDAKRIWNRLKTEFDP